MTKPAQQPSDRADEQSLAATSAADEELLAALADDFGRRVRRGEHPKIDEYIAKHPALAERMGKVLSAIALMEQARSIDSTSAGEGSGSIIGRYKLLERIGEGGFGVVYMAEQQTPVRRRVALKLIKPGMDSRQVLARFEAERQALAIMDHPNIAKVLDAGATETGRPYFVMELVKGEPITEFCDRNHFTPRQRLELLAQVCHAVQHAHQKGIIHRALKPSNVLVMMHDTTPMVKVIDFGVAKALAQELTDKTLFTGFAQLVGTPLYMSPEQAGQSSLDIDTRSDIYSLGVLLYELLTGTTPFDKERFKKAAQDEIRRIIREEDPPKPSTRLSESKDSLPSISAQRQTEPAKLTKLVRGELDWIVMKALEKDRGRRYETANGLAADVQRYLADEQVLAYPPSKAYRLKKFIRRNKGPVWAAAAVLLTLVGGIVGTTIGLLRAERARQDAVTARLAESERAQGESLARQDAQAILNFVETHILAAARPQDLGHDVTVRRAIEAALPFIDKSFADRPLFQARLHRTFGNSFLDLGEAKLAAEQFSQARALYIEHRGPEHRDTLRNEVDIANCYFALGRRPEALALREQTLSLQKTSLGPDHPDTLVSMHNLANSYADAGRTADAIALYETTLALRKTKLGADHADTLMTMGNLANRYGEVGRSADALRLREETLALQKTKLGAAHPGTLATLHNLANSYDDLGRHVDALTLREEALTLMQAKLGSDHPATLRSMHALGTTYENLGRRTDALRVRERTLALRKAKLGPDHPETLLSMQHLAISYDDLGRPAQAAKLFEETLSLQQAKLGADHPDTLWSMHYLAKNRAAEGRHAEALRLREQTLALRKTKLGPDHRDTLQSMHDVAKSYNDLGRYADAIALYEQTRSLQEARLGTDHRDTLWTMSNLADSYQALGRDADALKLRQQTLSLRKVKLGPDHADTLASMNSLASSLIRSDRGTEAIPLIDECIRRGKATAADPRFIRRPIDLRLRYYQENQDASGCRATAQMWEDLKFTDAVSLYNAARYRAVTAAVVRASDRSVDAARTASAEADRAMDWLSKAAAAGFTDAGQMKKDQDLGALRDRDDFQKLVLRTAATTQP